MKFIFVLTILITCYEFNFAIEQSSSMPDTLVIKTQKEMGFGLFLDLATGGVIKFIDTTEYNNHQLKYPKNVTDIKVALEIIDNKPYYYEKYKSGNFDTIQFLKWITEKKIDTLNMPSELDNSICIMNGVYDDKKIFIVDSNNNKDFRDDSIRHYNQNVFETITKVKYKIFNGLKVIVDSSWCVLPSFDGNNISFFIAHHLLSNINIDGEKFQIGLIATTNSKFTFDKPIISLISENENAKERLMTKDFIEKGEYLKLGKVYYLFSDISNDGEYLTLIKENNFDKKIGTQLGMIAPEFKIKTADSIIINSNTNRNRLLLLANISACNPVSYDNFTEMVESKKRTINIIGIEYGLNNKFNGIMIDTKDTFNLDFYKLYRKAWSDYNCFLIDASNRIIEKFSVFEWESVLKKY